MSVNYHHRLKNGMILLLLNNYHWSVNSRYYLANNWKNGYYWKNVSFHYNSMTNGFRKTKSYLYYSYYYFLKNQTGYKKIRYSDEYCSGVYIRMNLRSDVSLPVL